MIVNENGLRVLCSLVMNSGALALTPGHTAVTGDAVGSHIFIWPFFFADDVTSLSRPSVGRLELERLAGSEKGRIQVHVRH